MSVEQPDGSIDEFSDDVGVTRVPLGVGDEMDDHVVQRHGAATPPWDVPDRVEREIRDGHVSERPSLLCESNDLVA